MGLTLDDSFLSYEGGNVGEWLTANWKLVVIALLVLAVLYLLHTNYTISVSPAEYYGGAPGRSGLDPGMLSALAYTQDTPYGSAMNRLGVDQDTVAIDGNDSEYFCGDNFTGTSSAGDATQNLNPAAPNYAPSAMDVANAVLQSGTATVPEARVAAAAVSRYRLGRITAQDCSLLNDIQQREATATYDWMNTVAESPYDLQKPTPSEHYVTGGPERMGNSRGTEHLFASAMNSDPNSVSYLLR